MISHNSAESLIPSFSPCRYATAPYTAPQCLNDELINKIFKTLTAMANTDNKAVGYVIIGVADKLKDAEKIKAKYNEDYVRVGSFYITGIDGEVKKYYEGNHDKYYSMIKNKLENAPITEHYRRQLVYCTVDI